MKKIGILTITNSGLNFGNRLQSFALQKYMDNLGIYSESIVSAKAIKHSIILSKLRRLAKHTLKNDRRMHFFSEFEKKYIRNARKIRFEGLNEAEFANQYDAFVAGSDQVWNPNFHFNSDFEFATFAPAEKRFSYAASIGVSSIAEEKKEHFKKLLEGMREISVREEDGAEIVQKLTGREARVHVDPTMLLEKEIYFSMEQKPEKELPERYLLMYFLGNIPDTYRRKIVKMAEKMKLPIVVFSENKNSEFYACGPQHFLYVLHHADYICTDSFHGSVFSILFEKQFSVFNRMDKDMPMYSRIETLVRKFGLQERMGSGQDEIDTKRIDYNVVKSRLIIEREKTKDYFALLKKEWGM